MFGWLSFMIGDVLDSGRTIELRKKLIISSVMDSVKLDFLSKAVGIEWRKFMRFSALKALALNFSTFLRFIRYGTALY